MPRPGPVSADLGGPLDLEQQAWEATLRGRAADVYDRIMAVNARVLLPEGPLTRREALERWAPNLTWPRHRLRAERAVPITDGITYLTYQAVAGARDEYHAACSSLFVRRGDAWWLVWHQRQDSF
ncbi:DUF4440 domain-containing protein [Amycolatopsis endophytica]